MEKKKMAIVVASGTLDKAYAALVIASTAATLDADVRVFFAFGGMNIIHKEFIKNIAPPPGMEILPDLVKKVNWPGLPDMLQMAKDAGVKLIACSATMQMLGYKKEDLVDGVEVTDADRFVEFALEANSSLFI